MKAAHWKVTGTAPSGERFEHSTLAFDATDAIDRIVGFYEPICFPVGTTWAAERA